MNFNMMKLRTLPTILLTLSLLVPCGLLAQKKGKIAVPKIITANDSISYSFGVGMGNSLANSFVGMGIVADTVQIRAMQQIEIDAVASATEKAELMKRHQFVLDSTNIENAKNMNAFFDGMKTVMQSKNSQTYKAGLSVGGQISSSASSFSEDILGGEGNFNTDVFVYGILSAANNDTPLFEDPESMVKTLIEDFQRMKQEEQQNQAKAMEIFMTKEEEVFLSQNKAKEGVVALPSGLQYKIEKEGNGEIPKTGDNVTVHYKGSLLDGTVFDSSIERGEPATFEVGRLVVGWNEALTLMPVGSKWILYIPFNLGYGARDMGDIPPYSTLVFELELLDLEK